MEKIAFKDRIANFLANNFKNIKGGYFGKERFLLTYYIYHILPYFGFNYPKLIEWKFILENLPEKINNIRILDVGCSSSLFIYKLAEYGKVFGIDSMAYFEKLPQNIKFFQCNVMNLPFPKNYFNFITLISVIEHIGLGFYGDPKYADRDFRAIEELRRILRPDGSLFMTTLIGNKYMITPDGNERIYSEDGLNNLIKDFSVIKERYYVFRKRWILVNKSEAFRESYNRFGLACLQLKNK